MKTERTLIRIVGNMPWWFFLLLSAMIYAAGRLVDQNIALAYVTNYQVKASDMIALGFLAPLACLFLKTQKKSMILSRQEPIFSLNTMARWEYLKIVSEAFSRLGFTVIPWADKPGSNPLLIKMVKNGQLTIVLLTRLKTVSRDQLEALMDILVTEGVAQGVVVSTGVFSPEAKRFSSKIPVLVINGFQLMIILNTGLRHVFTNSGGGFPGHGSDMKRWLEDMKPRCPCCGSVMNLVLRQVPAPLWRCSRYPECRRIKRYQGI